METSTTLDLSSAITPAVGKPLKEVRYWCLKEEASEEDIYNSHFYHGGIIKLVFEDDVDVFLTWSDAHDWETSFCISGRATAVWDADYYRDFDASNVPSWKTHLGEKLKQVNFLGWAGIPFVCALTFESGTLYVGIGDGYTFADKDDIMIRDHSEFWLTPYLEGIELID